MDTEYVRWREKFWKQEGVFVGKGERLVMTCLYCHVGYKEEEYRSEQDDTKLALFKQGIVDVMNLFQYHIQGEKKERGERVGRSD